MSDLVACDSGKLKQEKAITLWEVIHPLIIVEIGFVFSWLYAIFPNFDFWAFALIKQEAWSIFGVALFAELSILCFPDLPDAHYLSIYGAGISLPAVLRIIAYFTNTTNVAFQLFVSVVSVPIMLVALILHLKEQAAKDRLDGQMKAVQLTSKRASNAAQSVDIDNVQVGTINILHSFAESSVDLTVSIVSVAAKHTCYDTYTASCLELEPSPNIRNSSSNYPSYDAECSAGRRLWQEAVTSGVISSSMLHQPKEHVHSTTETSLVSNTSRRGIQSKIGWRLLFPRFYQRSLGISDGTRIRELYPLRQIGYLTAFSITFVLFFFFLVYFAQRVKTSKTSESGSSDSVLVRQAAYFFVFVVGAALIRMTLKRSGLALDAGKRGTTSVFFVAEFAGLMYYFTFYRLLFEAIDDWGVFFAFQAVHFFIEWMCYPLRAVCIRYLLAMSNVEDPSIKTSTMFVWFQSLLRTLLLPQGTSERDWLEFIGLDFGVRIIVMLCSSISIVLLLLTITYVPWIRSDLQNTDHRHVFQSCLFIVVAVGLEMINAVAINTVCFKPYNINILHRTMRCFRDVRFATMAIIISTNLLINPIYAFGRNTTYHYHA